MNEEERMEHEPHAGAGPETTGIKFEQLSLFDQNEINERDAGEPERIDDMESLGVWRPHRLGHRPDRLHTSGHSGVRGDRLERSCGGHDGERRWTPRPIPSSEGVHGDT